MSAGAAVSAWDKVSGWMGGLSGAIDAIMKPLVDPLTEMFDSVTGDSQEVRSVAERWRSLSRTVEALERHHREVIAPVAASWDGEAADAFSALMRELDEEIRQLADGAGQTADFLDDAAMEVELAEELVAGIIRELIEWALLTLEVNAALAIVTVGASAVAGAVAAAAEAAVAYSRIAAVLTKVALALQRIATLLKAVKAMRFFSMQGLLFKTILVKGMLLKPVVRAGTGLTGNPLQVTGDTLRDLAAIAADEVDDVLDGNTDVQTPWREAINPGARGVAPIVGSPVGRGVSDVADRLDDLIPAPPGG